MSAEQSQQQGDGNVEAVPTQPNQYLSIPRPASRASSMTLHTQPLTQNASSQDAPSQNASTQTPVSATDDNLDEFYEKLFAAVTTASTFGGGLAFARVIAAVEVPVATANKAIPKQSSFNAETVRTFLAVGWFLFTANVCLSGACTAAVHLKHKGENKNKKNFHHYLNHLAALVLTQMLVAALVFECLAVVAYCPIVGWLATGFMTLFGLGTSGWWLRFLWKRWETYGMGMVEGWQKFKRVFGWKGDNERQARKRAEKGSRLERFRKGLGYAVNSRSGNDSNGNPGVRGRQGESLATNADVDLERQGEK